MGAIIKFIRKGSGVPFPQGQYTEKELRAGVLPGLYPSGLGVWKANFRVRCSQHPQPFELSCFLRSEAKWAFGVTAGMDCTSGRPSFLTIEETGEMPNFGLGIEYFTSGVEYDVKQVALAQSENIVDDLIKERYVAQWSLVRPPVRKGLKMQPAVYELSATYQLAKYRSEGVWHLCLGDLIGLCSTEGLILA